MALLATSSEEPSESEEDNSTLWLRERLENGEKRMTVTAAKPYRRGRSRLGCGRILTAYNRGGRGELKYGESRFAVGEVEEMSIMHRMKLTHFRYDNRNDKICTIIVIIVIFIFGNCGEFRNEY